MSKKVVVGISGGVDSSVAALLLKEQGYEVIGVTMQIWQDEKSACLKNEEDGDEPMAIRDARRVAEALDIPHFVLNFRTEFQRDVIDYFVGEYLHGRTPNPCVLCNRKVKWEALLSRSREFGAEYIATGHYARICQLENGRYAVRNSVTAQKDQTYALFNLTQDQLARTLMPVGEYAKDDIRKIAEKNHLPVASKPDSQEICFIPDNDYARFIDREAAGHVPSPGNFVYKDGTIIGKHKGITHYTVGQRKGLNLAMGHPVFVTRIDPVTDEVWIGDADDVFATELIADQVNYMGVPAFEDGQTFIGKVRYGHKGSPCRVYRTGEKEIKCVFEEPVRAITPGQAVVLYQDGYVAGGGIIK